MVPDPFVEEDFRVLTPEAFEFVLKNELKRALRSQNFVTLVLLQSAVRGAPANGNGEREQAVRDVARVISREMRETDLISRTGKGELSVVLLDADMENALRVIERVMSRLEHYRFPKPLAFEIGAACCPTHGSDVESLRRAAHVRSLREPDDRSNAQ